MKEAVAERKLIWIIEHLFDAQRSPMVAVLIPPSVVTTWDRATTRAILVFAKSGQIFDFVSRLQKRNEQYSRPLGSSEVQFQDALDEILGKSCP